VYRALGELMHNPIHALAITARTPQENAQDNSQDTSEETKGRR
jgi:acid stress-induced BolA-like protein IbaG/YrbA